MIVQALWTLLFIFKSMLGKDRRTVGGNRCDGVGRLASWLRPSSAGAAFGHGSLFGTRKTQGRRPIGTRWGDMVSVSAKQMGITCVRAGGRRRMRRKGKACRAARALVTATWRGWWMEARADSLQVGTKADGLCHVDSVKKWWLVF